MSGPRYHEVGFTSNQEIIQSPEAPHHSSVCIEDKSYTKIMLPPLEMHDPIAHALEESYTSTCARHKFSVFLSFACMSQSIVCLYLTSSCSVTRHRGKFLECISCAFTHFCSVDVCKLGVCLSSLLYFSHLLVRTTG